MSSKSCCNNSKTNITFTKCPKIKSWTADDEEVTLFSERICLGPQRQIVIDSIICAEISGLVTTEPNSSATAYNNYKLYIDDTKVSQSGFEAENDKYAPNLSSSSLMWGGHISCKNCVTVVVTAQLYVTSPSTSLVTSNINNSIGSFRGTKEASLRVLLF
mgnify:CR=1 FL=1